VIAADRRPSPSWGKREQAVQRFEHYELVTGEGGKPAELGRAAMGAFDIDLHSVSGGDPAARAANCRKVVKKITH
jgi:hypothetical protein